MNQELGASYPAYAGATGKLLLAHLEPAELDRYLTRVALQPLTARTVVEPERLREELAVIRRLGVSVSRGERVDDAVAISAPLRDRSGRVIAAVTVSGVASRFGHDELVATVRATLDCAEAIAHELGWVPSRDADPDHDTLLAEHCDAALADRTPERSSMAAAERRGKEFV
jgi:DNA-binding IclR family transcriptional regulator